MEIRSQTETHMTIRMSKAEIAVANDVLNIGLPTFIQMLNDGHFSDRGKAYNITANKIANGYKILPSI